ncbi:MAG: hypothetical protein M3373_07370 [Gemmatimonadota bacterium]|nr:hypothetical protein [Gemmatimonadota bacterium]
MMAYLQRLRMALLTRNALEARRLLNHPLSTFLPLRVREEARVVTQGAVDAAWMPAHLTALYEEAERLLADQRPAAARGPQLELPLGPILRAFDMSLTIARAAILPRARRPSLTGRRAAFS